MKNSLLNELYEIRAQILAEHKDDLGDYLHAEFERAKAAGHPVADIQQRSVRRAIDVKSYDSAPHSTQAQ